ncbi:hypothetical protein Tco_0307934 [Tanacetum coccineum]
MSVSSLTLESDGPFQPKTVEGANNPEAQWSNDERRVVNQDQHLKSIIMSCLPDDISYATAKKTWTDLVHSFESPSDTKENMIMDLKLEHNTFRAKPSNDFQENSDDEVDERTSEEYLRDLDIEFHERALLARPKRFFLVKKQMKTLGVINVDDEEVSDDKEMTQVKVLMTLADDELAVGKNHARNGEWIDITMRKVHILLSMNEDAFLTPIS